MRRTFSWLPAGLFWRLRCLSGNLTERARPRREAAALTLKRAELEAQLSPVVAAELHRPSANCSHNDWTTSGHAASPWGSLLSMFTYVFFGNGEVCYSEVRTCASHLGLAVLCSHSAKQSWFIGPSGYNSHDPTWVAASNSWYDLEGSGGGALRVIHTCVDVFVYCLLDTVNINKRVKAIV